jgi:membrane-bound acyltransferase YfiQ involved in biofilm formation
MFLRYVHSFRAVAIVIIVAGHAVITLDRAADPATTDFLLDLFDNGTVLFVFIAGFLFEHLSRRFAYGNYLRKKLTNVIVPYLLVSIPAVLYTVFLTDAAATHPEYLGGTSKAYQIGWMFLTGGGTFNYAVWFVPMITLFYLAAPAFMLVVRQPRLYWLIVPLLVLSTLMHRPPEVITPEIALYFLPAYLLGMWASHVRERLEPALLRSWPWLMAAFVLGTVARFTLSEHHGNDYVDAMFSQQDGPIDWMFLQKVLLCFALLGLMMRLDAVLGERLAFLADISFTVFFVHCYLLFAFQSGWLHLFGEYPPGNALTFVVLTAVVVVLTAGGTALAKRLLGKRSRYLIGS